MLEDFIINNMKLNRLDSEKKPDINSLVGNCDFCKHKKHIGIFGKPCVTPEPCLYETGKKNWEYYKKLDDE